MQITASLVGASALQAQLSGHARQVPFATRQAINATANKVRTVTYGAMRANFDRPTPNTLKSLFIRYASLTDLAAEVFVKDKSIGGNQASIEDSDAQGSMAQILGHQFSGGIRVFKTIEKAFAANGYLKGGEYIAPGPDAKLDAYGNMSRGQVQQIYTALRLHFDVANNATGSRRSRRNALAAGRLFWSMGPPLNKTLRRGLWGVDGRGNPKLILVPISKAVYRQRIDMAGITAKVVPQVFPGYFQAELAKAIAGARP